MESQRHILIALGSNLQVRGLPPREVLPRALDALGGERLIVRQLSRLYCTPCFPTGSGPDYVNAAARLHTDLEPNEVMVRLHKVEEAFGRKRVERWGRRGLDLDLLADGDKVLPDRETFERWRDLPFRRQRVDAPETLILPHPRLHERAFVLVPLADVAPDWRHPVLGRTVGEMLAGLPSSELDGIRPV